MGEVTNLARMQAALREGEVPNFLVSDIASVAWLTGFTGSFGNVLVTPTDALLLTDSRYTLQAGEQCSDMPVVSFRSPVKFIDFLYENIQTLGLTRLLFDENQMTVGTFRKYAEKFQGVELLPGTDPITKLRMVKSADEVRRIRAACRLADACLEHVIPQVRPGITENELLLEIETFFRKNGSQSAFPSIVVSGERSARPHGTPSNKALEVGDFVTFDLGARVEGYCSDITRTVVVGEATEKHRDLYAQLLKAQLAALDALKPGAKGTEIDTLVRTVLDEKGLASFFGHGLGHGLGALVHDYGRLSQTDEVTIEVGQIWTVEPGVYVEGFGGVRIEDDVLVTTDGVEILTAFPKELLVIK